MKTLPERTRHFLVFLKCLAIWLGQQGRHYAMMVLQPLYWAVVDRIFEHRQLQPKGVYSYSAQGLKWRRNGKRIILPNLAGEFHPVMTQWIGHYGLGQRCLLVSECHPTKRALEGMFPETIFRCSDFFTELHGSQAAADYRWNVCLPPPPELRNERFDSIVAYALLEHVLSPFEALRSFHELLAPGGRIFVYTHLPSYHKHCFPSDYIRFHLDFFPDACALIREQTGIRSELLELHAFRGIVQACYRRVGGG